MLGSPAGNINKVEFNQWLHNALLFLAPLAVIYLSSLAGVLQEPDHVVSVNDFALNSFRLGAIVTYLVNVIYDFLRKYVPATR